jgi:hypothetical protein
MKKIKHIPFQPPRESVPMEGIYLQLWRDFAESRPDEWKAIFSDCPFNPRQRAASVAASFMTYMGCNGGLCFTRRAEELIGEFKFPEPAYIASWAIENARNKAVNSGLRTIEYMLAREHPIKHKWPNGVNWKAVPCVTMEDIDVIDSMVRWWAGTTAKAIREQAEALLAAQKAKEHLQHHLDNNIKGGAAC